MSYDGEYDAGEYPRGIYGSRMVPASTLDERDRTIADLRKELTRALVVVDAARQLVKLELGGALGHRSSSWRPHQAYQGTMSTRFKTKEERAAYRYRKGKGYIPVPPSTALGALTLFTDQYTQEQWDQLPRKDQMESLLVVHVYATHLASVMRWTRPFKARKIRELALDGINKTLAELATL